MTSEKQALIIFTLTFFILCLSIFSKTETSKKKHIFFSATLSMGAGLCSLGAVYLTGIVFGQLLAINFCTVFVSLLGSIPAVAAMLFLNVI